MPAVPGASPAVAPLAYDAFISYSRKADGELASKLQKALETIATPWYRRRSIRVFRDETTLKPTPAMWESIRSALDQSRYFILLASPDAAASEWVQREIAHWLETPKPGLAPPASHLLLALTDGQLHWDSNASPKPGYRPRTPGEPLALPPALLSAFDQEPLYVDFSWAHDARTLTLKHPPSFNNVARLAAALRGMELDELIGENIRQHRRALGTALAGGALVLGLGSTAGLTWRQARSLTEEKRRQTDAGRVLPQLETQLASVRKEPTRRVALEFAPESFFGDQTEILELRLELDPLFTVPMSFFFAKYVEGKTWPAEFGFGEPSYTEFSHPRARVDAKLAWFDRVLTLDQTIDGSDAGRTPSFNIELDGSRFTPGGPGIRLPQTLEIPSLQALIDRKVRFSLFAHDTAARVAREIDMALRPVRLRVLARHGDSSKLQELVLFDGSPTTLQEDVLGGDFLFNRGPIERVVLANLYPPVLDERRQAYEAKRQQLQQLLQTRTPTTADERRLLARGLEAQASLAAVRGDGVTALNASMEVVRVLEPLVFETKSPPRRDDGERLYLAAVRPVAILMRARRFDRVPPYLGNLPAITNHLLYAAPDEPDFLRWRADADLWAARHAIRTEQWPAAASALASNVQLLARLHKQLVNDASRGDLVQALEQSLELAGQAPEGHIPTASWRAQLQALARAEAPAAEKPKKDQRS